MKTKICKICNKRKKIDQFGIGRNYRYKNYNYGYCKKCERIRVKNWRINNPKEFKLIQRRANLLYSYGITLETYNSLLEQQNGLCAICGKSEVQRQNLSVDHNHKTGEVRSLLCHKCNRAIGLLQDSPEIAKKLVLYLLKYR